MKTQDFPSALYVIGTPIGNLGDLTVRAKEVLSAVNWIAAEDTRETRKLLDHLGLNVELLSFHEHSNQAAAQKLVERIRSGERGAYVSDAGTPGVSDPGAVLVDLALTSGLRVVPIPGASALTALLSVTGYAGAGPVVFDGFLPREKLAEFFSGLGGGVHVFFESPHRVLESLGILAKVLPDTRLVMGRELTKKFEEVRRGSPGEILMALEDRPETERRGEFVFALLVEAKTEEVSEEKCRELFAELVALGANQKILVRVGEEQGLKRNAAYKLALAVLAGVSGAGSD